MSIITTELLIASICNLCGIRKGIEVDQGRVFTKEELLLIQATIIKLQQENRSLSSRLAYDDTIANKVVEAVVNVIKDRMESYENGRG